MHMRRLFQLLSMIVAAFTSTAAHAQWTTPPVAAPGLQYRSFWSPTAQATVSFHVYVPPAYDADPVMRFPVLYWLHGSGSPIAGIPAMRNWFASAMAQGRIPPMLVVFPNGMGASMWCDSKDGVTPMESVVIDDLIPHVDSTFRTIASRRGRIIEGFSMGGAGSGRLALRRPDLFAGVSMLGAGPMQLDFMDAPKGTGVPPEQRAELFERVWGSDPAYYLAEHPWTIAAQRADAHIALRTRIRIGVGSLDAMLPANADFHSHLLALGVPHQLVVVPGVGHDALLTLQGLGLEGWNFYLDALATPCRQPADLDCSGTVDAVDLAAVLAAWGPGSGVADINGSGNVDAVDLALLLAAWGTVQ
jgi:enterochelin esterase-like enzyme